MSFISDAEIVARALDTFYDESISAQRPVIHQAPLEQIILELNLAAHVRDGGLTGQPLADFVRQYLTTTTSVYHPEFLAHQGAVPYYAGALGSLIDGFTANPMAIFEMGPAATSVEVFVINWMLEKVGWPPAPVGSGQAAADRPHGGGVLTHGGSLANLTALIAARNQAAPEAWELGVPRDLVLLAPAASHYSIARAAGILGIGQQVIYPLAVDPRGAVIPEQLAVTFAQARHDGKRPIAVVANACQTATGIYDPLDEIGDFCNAHHVWLHVDGAHGASALLSGKYRHLLKGVEKADSLTWDAHKMLRTPTVCAAVLLRDHRPLETAFQQEASYLFHEKEQPGVDLGYRTLECTKAALGLRLFMVLGALGESGLTEYVERQWDLAQQAYDYINAQPDFECAVRPESNILCFRTAGCDQTQLQIRDALIAQGRFYLSSAVFCGQRYLRLTLMSPWTELKDIECMVEMIRHIADGAGNQPGEG
jgi:L-2,4-diaminobutyrate decarboxylase